MHKYLTFYAASYNENSRYLLQALTYITKLHKVKGKAIPLQYLTDFKTIGT
jgi:hypothetical protein